MSERPRGLDPSVPPSDGFTDGADRSWPPPGRAPTPQTVLRRPRTGRVLFGVAAGLARHLGVDPVVVRVGFVLLTVFGGSGVLLYLVGALVVPVEAAGDPVGRATGLSQHDTGVAVGAVLVVGGTLALAGQLLPQSSSLLGPAVLLLTGVVLLVVAGRR